VPEDACIFCDISRRQAAHVYETRHTFAIPDRVPASPGHTLIITKRHVSSVFDLTDEEWTDIGAALRALRDRLGLEQATDSFRIGINTGAEAGQTVFHAHVHLIPQKKLGQPGQSNTFHDAS